MNTHFTFATVALLTIPLSHLIAVLSPLLGFITLLAGAITSTIGAVLAVHHAYKKIKEWIAKRKTA